MATVYRTIASIRNPEIGAPTKSIKWFSSEAQAKASRKETAAELNLRSYKDVEVEQLDMPTSKAGILGWLNANHIEE